MKKLRSPFAFLAAAIAAFVAPGTHAETLKEGDPVPKITAADDAGNPIDLAEAALRRVRAGVHSRRKPASHRHWRRSAKRSPGPTGSWSCASPLANWRK